MGFELKKNMTRMFILMIAGIFSGLLSQSAMARTSTCSPGDNSWPCFAAERSAKKRVAKKSFRAKRALKRRSTAKKRRSTIKKRKARNNKKVTGRKNRYSRKYRKRIKRVRTSRKKRAKKRSKNVIYLSRNGRKISKRRAAAMTIKRTKNRSKHSRRAKRLASKKLRHTHKKKKSTFNKGFSLRGRHMKVTSASIKTSCFPKRLRRLISRVERRYGKRLIVTSGFRSRAHNRRIGGASRSEHVHCRAVDFRIPGVNKYALARFVKTLPGIGGVGTYCAKSTIHMDIGKRRSWNHGCGKKRRYAKRYKLRRKSRRSYRTTSKRRSQRARWNFNF